jgi:hypothetical protein
MNTQGSSKAFLCYKSNSWLQRIFCCGAIASVDDESHILRFFSPSTIADALIQIGGGGGAGLLWLNTQGCKSGYATAVFSVRYARLVCAYHRLLAEKIIWSP